MADYVFNITGAKWETPYTIVFTGNCTQCIGEFKVKYSGTDLINESSACIPEEWLSSLKEALNRDYGYGPREKNVIKGLLKKYNRYEFNYTEK